MGFLADKKILITGILSTRSIAYGVARACHREGATLAFTYVNDDAEGSRRRRSPPNSARVPVLPCDVTQDDQIDALFAALKSEWGALDGLLHSIAFAPREALVRRLSRRAVALGVRDRARRELVQLRRARQGRAAADAGPRGVALTLTYLGAHAHGAQLQRDGPRQGEPRGERALSRHLPRARGHPRERHFGGADQDARRRGHRQLFEAPEPFEKTAPLRRNVTIDEVGNVAAFYFSDLSSAITGEITYVDCGFSTRRRPRLRVD